eukprot:TRINITY_DN5667_c0_g1_i4.p1 TRINITY_DN5667_c0_g1~~TRINITY_DN5667_c0_g1_i4.p1  ORF type:complete len:135 (-),score=19.46 TRINITY_DN5667_c0_g1_i4:260-631(-)
MMVKMLAPCKRAPAFAIGIILLGYVGSCLRRHKGNAELDLVTDASSLSEVQGPTISFAGGGYGMAVVAQAVLSALSEQNCARSNATCSIKVDEFSMITGVSGGGWGIGLYANNNTKPDLKTNR